jgi:hypothetical protein
MKRNAWIGQSNERLEALAVRELQMQPSAVTFHQTESVEFSYMPLIAKRPEVSPIDFEAFSGPRFHAYVGARGSGLRAHSVQVLFQNAQTAAEAERPELLCDHRGRGLRVLRKELGDVGLEGIQSEKYRAVRIADTLALFALAY